MVVQASIIRNLYVQFLEGLVAASASPLCLMAGLQKAHWFYLDHVHNSRREGPPLSLCQFVHRFVPLLQWEHTAVKGLLKDFWKLNASLPRAGGVLLNHSQTKLVLVQAPGSKWWKFPVGKVGLDEAVPRCAEREVFEETGYQGQVSEAAVTFEFRQHKAPYTLFVFPNVPEDYEFAPLSWQEIQAVRWFGVDELLKVVPRSLVRVSRDLLTFLGVGGGGTWTLPSPGSSADASPALQPVATTLPCVIRSLELLSLEPFAPLQPLGLDDGEPSAASSSASSSCIRI